MRKGVRIFLLTVIFFSICFPVFASEEEELYGEQYDKSGAGELPSELPDETQDSLSDLGIYGANWYEINDLSPGEVFSKLIETAGEEGKNPLSSALAVIGMILLCAVFNAVKPQGSSPQMPGTVDLVGTLCVSAAVIYPLVACIDSCAKVIYASAAFTGVCVPVMAGILITGGKSMTAASYSFLMLGAGNILSVVSGVILVPLLNIFLAFSVCSGISPNLRLSGICNAVSGAAKWILGLCTTVFTALLGLQTFISSTADSGTVKTARFLVSSFVPVVGGALGDAYTTVQGCVRLLKSGVGAFIILAQAVLFLPALLRCLLWMAACSLCAGVGELFSLSQISSLLRAAGKTAGILFSVLICCMLVMTVSAVFVMGGSAA